MATAMAATGGARTWRRRVIAGWLLAACSLLLAPAPAAAREPQALPAGARCSPAGLDGLRRCEIGWTEDRMRNLWQPQELTNWCWSAAVAMLFSASGVVISQPDIVEEQYGEVLDAPEHMVDVLDLLNRTWSDAQGRRFRFATELAGQGVDLRSLAESLLADMELGRPWLIFHARHVVLLPRLHLEIDPVDRQARIVGATVLDPDPAEGVRPLRAQEWAPRYAVRVRIVQEDD